MKEQLIVKAEKRAEKGSAPAGRLRRQGSIPGVVYGDGKPGEDIQLNAHDFEKFLHHQAGEHMILDLAVGADPVRKVLLKDVQHHPIDGHVIHVDFHAIAMDRKLRVRIPVVLAGEPVGVTQQGGILDFLLRDVEVECLPADLMERITVDVSALELGKHLSVRDIQLDAAKYRVVTPADVAVAAVSAPKAEEVAAAETPAEGATAGEPEVIKEKKGEEGEAAPAGKDAKAEGKGEKESKKKE